MPKSYVKIGSIDSIVNKLIEIKDEISTFFAGVSVKLKIGSNGKRTYPRVIYRIP